MVWTGAAVLILALVGAAYFRISWSRMESSCLSEKSTISYAWSWNPTGFRCESRDGSSETALWF